jgi:signal transduction histidine kinase
MTEPTEQRLRPDSLPSSAAYLDGHDERAESPDAPQGLEDASSAVLTAGLVHDLRAPLQCVLGWASVLKRGCDPALIERAATVIERNARLQVALIEDLLEVLRPTGTGPLLHPQTIDLAALVTAELRAVEPLAEERGLCVSVTAEPQEVAVQGNETHLRRVIGNLVGNGLKFTPPGGSIQCRVFRSECAAGVIVRNMGPDLERRRVPRGVAGRVDTPAHRSRRDPGWGLGLSIVRHLVRLHGGTVTAASAGAGSGATYSVLLPAAPYLVEAGDRSVVRAR